MSTASRDMASRASPTRTEPVIGIHLYRPVEDMIRPPLMEVGTDVTG